MSRAAGSAFVCCEVRARSVGGSRTRTRSSSNATSAAGAEGQSRVELRGSPARRCAGARARVVAAGPGAYGGDLSGGLRDEARAVPATPVGGSAGHELSPSVCGAQGVTAARVRKVLYV